MYLAYGPQTIFLEVYPQSYDTHESVKMVKDKTRKMIGIKQLLLCGLVREVHFTDPIF
jgi:hypothetical protein